MNKVMIMLLFLFFTSSLTAQKTENMASIKAKKIAYITDKLSLTPQQAEKFWPLYNVYNYENKQKRKDKLKGKGRELFSEENLENMTNEQAEEHLTLLIKKEEEKLQSKKDFVEKLKSVLETKQILQLFRSEQTFKREIFRDYKRQVRNIEE